ncbi:MAG: hypothetical protein R2882_15055 [Gemmatimonadales bacterium]
MAMAPVRAEAQEARLARLPAAARAPIETILAEAGAAGLPTEPLIDRALEGTAKGAAPDLIVRAVTRLHDELTNSRQAFGAGATVAELTAGASALRAGAKPADLARLRTLRSDRPLTVAAGVLADLVAAGVPADTATAAVLALVRVEDADYIAFRRNVQRDVALGASPAAALGVRLRSFANTLTADAPVGEVEPGAVSKRPRKP